MAFLQGGAPGWDLWLERLRALEAEVLSDPELFQLLDPGDSPWSGLGVQDTLAPAETALERRERLLEKVSQELTESACQRTRANECQNQELLLKSEELQGQLAELRRRLAASEDERRRHLPALLRLVNNQARQAHGRTEQREDWLSEQEHRSEIQLGEIKDLTVTLREKELLCKIQDQQNKGLLGRLGKARQALQKLYQQGGQALRERDEAQARVRDLETNLLSTKVALQTAHLEASKLNQSLSEREARIVSLQGARLGAHQGWEEEMQNLRLEREDLATRAEDTRLQLERAQDALLKLGSEAGLAVARRETSQQELEQLQQQLHKRELELSQQGDDCRQQLTAHSVARQDWEALREQQSRLLRQGQERLATLEGEQTRWRQEKEGLGQQILSLQAEIQSLEARSSRHDLEIALATLKEEHSSQRQALSEHCRQLGDQLTQLRLDREQLASGGEANQLQLKRTQQAFIQLRTKAGQALAQRDVRQLELEQRLSQETRALCQHVQQLQHQLQLRDDELHRQGEHHHQALERLGALESKQISWHQEMGELRVWGLQLQNQLEQANQTVADLQVDGLQLKTEIQQFAQARDRLQQRVASLDTEIESLQERLRQGQEQLHASLRARAQLSADADESQSQLLQLREDAVILGEQLTLAQHQRDEALAQQSHSAARESCQQDNDYQQQLAEQTRLLRHGQERLAILEGEQTRWRQEKDGLGQQILSLQAEVQTLENRSSGSDLDVALARVEEEHSSERHRWQKEWRALQIERANLAERVSGLEAQLLNQQQDWAASEAAGQGLSERCRQLCEQLSQLRSDRDQLASLDEANRLQLKQTQQAFIQLRAKAAQVLAQRDAGQGELEQRLSRELAALCQQVEQLRHQLQQRDDELRQQGDHHQQTLEAHTMKCQAWERGAQEQNRLLRQAQERLAALESEQTRWNEERGELMAWGQRLQRLLDQTNQTVIDLQVDGLQIKNENDQVAQARDRSEQQVASLKSEVRSLQEHLHANLRVAEPLRSKIRGLSEKLASAPAIEQMLASERRLHPESQASTQAALEQSSGELGEAMAQLEGAQNRLQELGETAGHVAFLQPSPDQPTRERLESDREEGLLRLPDLRRGRSHFSIPLSLPSFTSRREHESSHSMPLLPGRLGATRLASAETSLLP